MKKVIIPFIVILGLSIAFLIMAIQIKPKTIINDFVPPEFEKNIKVGVPVVSKELAYGDFEYKEGIKATLCSKLKQDEEGFTYVYITNPIENIANIKLRIFDTDGKVIGETGLIKPGEYLDKVKINKNIKEKTEITLKIMCYEPNTYYSLGAFNLTTYISRGE